MKGKNLPAFLLLIALSFIGCIRAAGASGYTLEVTPGEGNRLSCSFDGVRHEIILDLPEKAEGAPLVMMLPGYGNTAAAFRNTVHFEQEANPLGYAVVYVTGAKDPNDPLSAVGWNSGIGAGGNDDTAFLVSLAKYLQDEYSFDKDRTFAAGFSNGAFMVHRLAMEAGDTFSAFVSVAGMMPAKIWDSRNDKNGISFFQISGEKDDVIPKNSDDSAEFSKDPAIEDVMAYWAESNGLELCSSAETENGSVLTVCRSERKADQVRHLFIKNGRHSWPTVKLNGINANRLILEFFETVSR